MTTILSAFAHLWERMLMSGALSVIEAFLIIAQLALIIIQIVLVIRTFKSKKEMDKIAAEIEVERIELMTRAQKFRSALDRVEGKSSDKL